MSDTSIERRIQVYPNPLYHKILIGWARSQMYTKAEAANNIIEDFFKNNFNDKQRSDFRKLYDSMTPEERMFPGRVKDD